MSKKQVIVKESYEKYVKEIEPSINYLAHYVARKSSVEFDDAKQELLLAAFRAYQSYNPNMARFSTYAVRRMKNRIKTLFTRYNSREQVTLIEDADLVEDETCVEESVLDEISRASDEAECKVRLDEIEETLFQALSSGRSPDKLAYEMFKRLRYGGYKEVVTAAERKLVPKTLSDVAAEMHVSVSRLSFLFKTKIRERTGAVIESMVDQETKIARRRRDMAKEKAKKGKTASKEAKSRGREPQKGGLRDKVDWVDKNFCAKGKTRPEAVAGLLEHFDGMSQNYARTLVYSSMKEYEFEPARERKPKSSKKAAAKAKPAKGKKVVEEDEDDTEDEDEDDTEDEDDEAPPKTKGKSGKKQTAMKDSDDFEF